LPKGVLVGVLSWLLAVPLGYPGAWAFSNVVGYTLVGVPFDFSYSINRVVVWLLVVIVLSALAAHAKPSPTLSVRPWQRRCESPPPPRSFPAN
jgi:hypothetical protein